MKKSGPRIAASLLVLMFISLSVYAQAADPQLRLQAYLNSFNSLDDAGKVQVLRSAAQDPVNEVIDLYRTAVRYVWNNQQRLATDQGLQQIVRESLPRLAEAGVTEFNDAIWRIFLELEDLNRRVEALGYLGPLAVNDPRVTNEMLAFLNSQVLSRGPDSYLVEALVSALENNQNRDVATGLVNAAVARVSEAVTRRAFEVLGTNNQGLASSFASALRLAIGEEKRDIFQLFFSSSFPSEADRTEFAVLSLEHLLSTSSRDASTQRMSMEMRRSAVRQISANNRADYGSLLVRHFNDTILAYDRAQVDKINLVEAIGALGTSNSPAAASRLTDFLNLINTYTQQDRPYDRQLALAVVESLGRLRAVESYNALFMVTVLNYPNPIKDAARDAMRLVAR